MMRHLKEHKVFLLIIIVFTGFFNFCWISRISGTTNNTDKLPKDSLSEVLLNQKIEHLSDTKDSITIVIKKDSNNLIDKLVFPNGNIIEVYNINPYNQIQESKIGTNKHGNNIYTIKSKKIEEVYSNFDSKKYIFSINELEIKKLESFTKVLIDSNYAIIANIADACGICFQTDITVVNSEGKIVSNIPEINTNVLDLSISENGLYLVMQYGYYDPEVEEYYIRPGISVYNTKTRELLLNFEEENAGFFVKNDLIFVSKSIYDTDRGDLMTVYDFANNKKFIRFFNYIELSNIKEITNKAYILFDKENNLDTLKFETDFKVEEL